MGLLTTSGNEITDATRKAALNWGLTQSGRSVDQFPAPDSSFGIWESGTNLHTRGQCDGGIGTGTSPWKPGGGTGTLSLDATVAAPFSPQSIKCLPPAIGNGATAVSTTGLSAASGTNAVGSIWFKGVAGNTYQCRTSWFNTDASASVGAFTNFVATGDWQLIAPTATAVAAGKTGDYIFFDLYCVTATGAFWVAHPMLQSGVSAVSPYIATSGGSTATRAAARVQVPSSLLNATQGWMALRMRFGAATGNSPVFWGWGPDNSNGLELVYSNSTSAWSFRRLNATVGAFAEFAAAPAVGAMISIVCAWTATAAKISVGGSAFNSVANSSIPTLVQTTFDIGSRRGVSNFSDSDILWFACGSGTITGADAATINGFTADPMLDSFPSSAQAQLVWSANTADYVDYSLIPIISGGKR